MSLVLSEVEDESVDEDDSSVVDVSVDDDASVVIESVDDCSVEDELEDCSVDDELEDCSVDEELEACSVEVDGDDKSVALLLSVLELEPDCTVDEESVDDDDSVDDESVDVESVDEESVDEDDSDVEEDHSVLLLSQVVDEKSVVLSVEPLPSPEPSKTLEAKQKNKLQKTRIN